MVNDEEKQFQLEEDHFVGGVKVAENTGIHATLLRLGLSKNRQQSNLITLAATFLILFLSYYIYLYASTGHSNAPLLSADTSYEAGQTSEVNPITPLAY